MMLASVDGAKSKAAGHQTTPDRIEWDNHRGEICRLYIDEGWRLKDVARFMADHRGFHATERMYKTKLSQWDVSKYQPRTGVPRRPKPKNPRVPLGEVSSSPGGGPDNHQSPFGVLVNLSARKRPAAAQPRQRVSMPHYMPPSDEGAVRQSIVDWGNMAIAYANSQDPDGMMRLKAADATTKQAVGLLTHAYFLFSQSQESLSTLPHLDTAKRTDIGGQLAHSHHRAGLFCRSGFALAHHFLSQEGRMSLHNVLFMFVRYPFPTGVTREFFRYLARYASIITSSPPVPSSSLPSGPAAYSAVQQPTFTYNPYPPSHPFRRFLTQLADYGETHGYGEERLGEQLRWIQCYPVLQFGASMDGKLFDYSMIPQWDLMGVWELSYRNVIFLHQWKSDEIVRAEVDLVGQGKTPDLPPAYLRADLLLIYGAVEKWKTDGVRNVAEALLVQNNRETHELAVDSRLVQLQGKQAVAQEKESRSGWVGYLEWACCYALAYHYRTRASNQTKDSTEFRALMATATGYLTKLLVVQKAEWPPPGKNYYEMLTLASQWHHEVGDYEAAKPVDVERGQLWEVLLHSAVR